MSLQEYQAKALFKKYGIPVLASCTASTVKEALNAAQKLGGNLWAVKAQVLAGGRGKAGGIKIVTSLAEVEKAAGDLLGKNLVTPQTGKAGERIHKVLVERGSSIAKEFYLSLLVDTSFGRVIFMGFS